MQEKKVLGIDIGGTKIAICLADNSGKLLATKRIKSGGDRPYGAFLPELLAACRNVLEEAGCTAEQIELCGISAPGPMDIAKGVLKKSPNMVWEDAPIRDDIERELGVKCILENDANAGALAEWYFGNGKGYNHILYLTMSTGIGAGIISHDVLLQGTTGVGGEAGHIILDTSGPECGCGMTGCFEAFCGGKSVSRRLRQALKDTPEHPMMALPDVDGDPEKLDYIALRKGVTAGIPFAMEMWDEICMRIAQALGGYMMIFNPQLIIMGTLASYSGDMLMKPLRDYLPRFCWKDMLEECELTTPGLGKEIGEYAGVAVAFYERSKDKAAETAPCC
jgi:glucokinase